MKDMSQDSTNDYNIKGEQRTNNAQIANEYEGLVDRSILIRGGRGRRVFSKFIESEVLAESEREESTYVSTEDKFTDECQVLGKRRGRKAKYQNALDYLR